MKFIKSMTLIASMLLVTLVHAQKFSEILNEERQFPTNSKENLLVVNNINGSVNVEGYNGTKVVVEVERYIKGYNSRQLDQGKAEVKMKIAQKDNIIYIYHDSPYTDFDVNTGRFGHKNNWNNNIKYDYKLNFKIKVPRTTNLELSTVNKGHLEVTNIEANHISVNNINGGITMTNVSGQTYANALNKDITISYTKNPTKESTFKSLNGDINIAVQKDLNADVSFKSLNGDIFTNVNTQSVPSKINMKKNSGKRGAKYKMNSSTAFKIGKGGVQLNFDVLNGDVTIKE